MTCLYVPFVTVNVGSDKVWTDWMADRTTLDDPGIGQVSKQ
ncbi:hypothetical protein HNR23_004705 [Nocardiopsis mwathae]|uniref:Uncharacterized protein n=1 Tax=Nocardiopsis mwathae TaxID=1472723 RepID=A0A7W9YMD2_9ACTN|nr:hypothetical protein [Nocardiopsis mwathae]